MLTGSVGEGRQGVVGVGVWTLGHPGLARASSNRARAASRVLGGLARRVTLVH
ncbi:hypothetical protein DPMN_026507 [Dreissena polymorpha]|uniref:Uncharacterized protein n=1 Tax=Dreissena polymorpha TaxID=45954 RepID=A0A9D4RDK0_DREPO|nr:hypothetical protein DPMN_026507 [Dreissena polymorpha]